MEKRFYPKFKLEKYLPFCKYDPKYFRPLNVVLLGSIGAGKTTFLRKLYEELGLSNVGIQFHEDYGIKELFKAYLRNSNPRNLETVIRSHFGQDVLLTLQSDGVKDALDLCREYVRDGATIGVDYLRVYAWADSGVIPFIFSSRGGHTSAAYVSKGNAAAAYFIDYSLLNLLEEISEKLRIPIPDDADLETLSEMNVFRDLQIKFSKFLPTDSRVNNTQYSFEIKEALDKIIPKWRLDPTYVSEFNWRTRHDIPEKFKGENIHEIVSSVYSTARYCDLLADPPYVGIITHSPPHETDVAETLQRFYRILKDPYLMEVFFLDTFDRELDEGIHSFLKKIEPWLAVDSLSESYTGVVFAAVAMVRRATGLENVKLVYFRDRPHDDLLVDYNEVSPY